MKNITRIALFFAFFMSYGIATSQVTTQDYKEYPHWIEMMQDQDANFFETQRAFYEYWQDREVTKGSGYKVFKRWEYWMSKRVSPEGVKPSPHKSVMALQSLKTKSTQLLTAGNWTPLGPFSVPSGYNGYRGLGRVNAIAFHPTDPNKLYIGAPSGGFWITNDGGATWETHTDILPTMGVSAIAVDYTNPDIIYMGTGDRDAGDAPGMGVWKSYDAGLTWQPSNTGMEQTTVGMLLIHPTDPNILIAATSGGIYRTINAGLTWTRSITGNYKDLVFKPGDHEVVYASGGGNFYRSINNGVAFQQINNGLPGGSRGVIAVSPANAEVVYFLLTNSQSFKGLYRSDDSGLSFVVRSTTPNIMSWDCDGGSGGQAWYDLDIAADPLNADVIFAGGVNCFKSVNGGSNWAINSHWYGGCGVPSVHADLHILEYSPVNNRLYAGNDGGVYWTANGGTSWTEISNGLVISQAYKIGQSATNKDFVINGYQDNGTSTYIGNNWISVGGGDGMECAFDPTDDRYSYSTVYYGSIDRKFNHNNQGQIAGEGVNGITEGGAWVTPFVIDHNDGNIMFIGYDNIWRSTNVKVNNTNSVSWTKISDHNVDDFDVLAQSRANTNILYAADGNRLYRSDNVKDASVEWTTLTGNLPSGNDITALETSPVDENIVYVVQQNEVHRSNDRGLTWTDLTNNLPDVQMNCIVYYRNSPEGLYLGTDIGIFYRDSSNPEWIQYSDGFPAAGRVTELEIYYDPAGPQFDVIRAGTYGRGLWESSLHYTNPTADFQADALVIPIGCGVNFSDLSVGIPFNWSWSFENATPATSDVQNPTGIVWNEPGTYTVTLIVSNPAGTDTIVKEAYITASGTLLPAASFTSSDRLFCSDSSAVVSFYDHSEFCPVSWEWSFDPADVTFMNGTTAESQNPEVTFNSPTNYSVTLTATNANGSSSTTMTDYVVIGGLALPFTENWDNAALQPNGWTVVNPDNGITWDIFGIQSDTGMNYAARMNYFNYNVNFGRRDQLISPPFNLMGYTNALLGFDHSYIRRFEGLTDTLHISVSEDCGATWTLIHSMSEDGTGSFQTHPIETTEYVPQSDNDWCNGLNNPVCTVLDISQFIGKSNVRIMFESVHRRGNNLFIDDIFVTDIVDSKGEKFISNSAINLFPNPGNNVFQLEARKELKNPAIHIFTSTGKVIFNRSLPTGSAWTINTGALPKGLYLVRVITTEGIWDEKLIVN